MFPFILHSIQYILDSSKHGTVYVTVIGMLLVQSTKYGIQKTKELAQLMKGSRCCQVTSQ